MLLQKDNNDNVYAKKCTYTPAHCHGGMQPINNPGFLSATTIARFGNDLEKTWQHTEN